MLSKSEYISGSVADRSFVADTLRSVGKDMKSKDMDEDDVEEHVSRSRSTRMRSRDSDGQMTRAKEQ